MKTLKFVSIVLLISLILNACTPTTVSQVPESPIPTAGSSPDPGTAMMVTPKAAIPTSQPPAESVVPTEALPAVDGAIKVLAAQLGIDISVIKVASIEAVDWPDGCLGAGKPTEMCLMVITPGYRVELEANSVTYEFHTDLAGKAVRLADGSGQNFAAATVVFAARQFLAKLLNVSLGAVTVVSSEESTWPDTCLGVPSGKACVFVVTPGYKIVLVVGGKQYEVHTDATGGNMILAPKNSN